MLETQRREIGGVTYEVRQLDAVRGRRVFVRFAKVVAPALGALKAAAKMSPDEALAYALGQLVGNVSEEDLDFFCDVFAPATCLVEGNNRPELAKRFELHFAGKYLEMLEWLAFCFEVNFGSFFQKLGPSSAS